MISHLFDMEFTVSRMSYVGIISTDGEVGSFMGHLQQLSQVEKAGLASGVSVTHRVWCALDADVSVGDTLSDGADTYSVRAVQRNADGANAHLELLIERDYEASA